MKKTILLTGAAGFIGSNFLRYMFDKYDDYSFIVLDALTYAGNQQNIPDKIQNSGRYEFWHGSVTNADLVDELTEKSSLIVHFAAESHVARSIYDDSKFFATDVIGTQTMMNALTKHKDTVERFIHISTSEVYGTAEGEVMDEDHPLNPRSPYAGAKAGADRLVYSYWHTYDLPATIIRPFNNYGSHQHLEKMMPRFITSALKNEPLTVHGQGLAQRDWLFVDDHCEALDKALHLQDFNTIRQQVINLGTGKATSVMDIAKMILKITNKPDDMLKYIFDRPGQVDKHISSTEKAQKLLGWTAKTSLEDGVSKVLEWYKNNEGWWSEIEWMREVPIHTEDGKIEMY